jgi:hypothetical protein
MRDIKTTVLCVVRASGGYTMTDHRRNEDVREEMGITDNSTAIKKQLFELQKRIPESRVTKLLCQYKLHGVRSQRRFIK